MLTFRNATPADAAALAGFFRDSFIATFGHLYAPQDLTAFLDGCPWSAGRRNSRAPISHSAWPSRTVCSSASPSSARPRCPARRQNAAELRQLYLAEAVKGAGVGASLMDWALATARARGAAELWLSVYVDNHRARRFYERFGFEDVGRYGFMVGKHEDEDRLMRLAL
jgi:GNAT superfamily N-acetyltransferase